MTTAEMTSRLSHRAQLLHSQRRRATRTRRSGRGCRRPEARAGHLLPCAEPHSGGYLVAHESNRGRWLRHVGRTRAGRSPILGRWLNASRRMRKTSASTARSRTGSQGGGSSFGPKRFGAERGMRTSHQGRQRWWSRVRTPSARACAGQRRVLRQLRKRGSCNASSSS